MAAIKITALGRPNLLVRLALLFIFDIFQINILKIVVYAMKGYGR